jgi:hypothetical protein
MVLLPNPLRAISSDYAGSAPANSPQIPQVTFDLLLNPFITIMTEFSQNSAWENYRDFVRSTHVAGVRSLNG